MRPAVKPLPVAPRPEPGELLSSWRDRLACRYGLEGRELSPEFLSGQEPAIGSPLDLDWDPGHSDIDFLAAAARLDWHRVAALALSRRGWPRTWITWQRAPDSTSPLGAYGAVEAAWCPACLRQDNDAGQDAWIRRDWAAAGRSLCPTHGLPLVQSCGRCDLWQPQRWTVHDGVALIACAHCNRPLQEEALHDDPFAGLGHRLWSKPSNWVGLHCFEHHLAAVLDGGQPDSRWIGPTSRESFLQLIGDLVHLLCRSCAQQGGDWAPIDTIVQLPWPERRSRRVRCKSAYPLAVLPVWWRLILLCATAKLLSSLVPRHDGPTLPLVGALNHGQPLTIATLHGILGDSGRHLLLERSRTWPDAARCAVDDTVQAGWERVYMLGCSVLQDRETARVRPLTFRKPGRAAKRRARQQLAGILRRLFQTARRKKLPACLAGQVFSGGASPCETPPRSLGLRATAEYRQMAHGILGNAAWTASKALDARVRVRLLGRLAREALRRAPCAAPPA